MSDLFWLHLHCENSNQGCWTTPKTVIHSDFGKNEKNIALGTTIVISYTLVEVNLIMNISSAGLD